MSSPRDPSKLESTQPKSQSTRPGSQSDAPSSRAPSESSSPYTAPNARYLAEDFLKSIHPTIRAAAEHALRIKGSTASSRAWMERTLRNDLVTMIERWIERTAPEPPSTPEAETKQEGGKEELQTTRFSDHAGRPADTSRRESSIRSITAVAVPHARLPPESALAPQDHRLPPESALALQDHHVPRESSLAPQDPLPSESSLAPRKRLPRESSAAHADVPRPTRSSSPPPKVTSPTIARSQGSPRSSKRTERNTIPPPPLSDRQGRPRQDTLLGLDDLTPPLSSASDLLEPVRKRLPGLRFMDGAHEAASFLLDLALEIIPARAGLAHVYDSEHHEFVVSAAVGPKAMVLESWASEESEPLIAEALRTGRPVHVAGAATDARLKKGRWAVLEPEGAVALTACTYAGQNLGLLELVHADRQTPFLPTELMALAELGRHYARFLRDMT